MPVIQSIDSGAGVGAPITVPIPVCTDTVTVLTQAQYRQWSNDFATPWYATGGQAGAQQVVALCEKEVRNYLSTYLEPTQHTDEEHRPTVNDRYFMGVLTERTFMLTLNWKQLLPDNTITVKWVASDQTRTNTACALIVNQETSKIELSNCAGSCYGYYKVLISYWSGFGCLPLQIQRAIALLARHDIQELVVSSVPIGEDIPWGAAEIQRVDMGFMRTWDSPTKYVAGEQGISVFGRGMVGIAAERLCADYRTWSVYQI